MTAVASYLVSWSNMIIKGPKKYYKQVHLLSLRQIGKVFIFMTGMTEQYVYFLIFIEIVKRPIVILNSRR